MFVTGQDVCYDIGTYYSFYSNYLHSKYVIDDVDLYKLAGKISDEISDGITLNIIGGDGAYNQYYPSEIDPLPLADPIFTYNKASSFETLNKGYDPERSGIGAKGTVSSGTGGIKVDTGVYKVVYLAFGFEAINNEDDRHELMKRIIVWLGIPFFEKLSNKPIITEIKENSISEISIEWEEYSSASSYTLYRNTTTNLDTAINIAGFYSNQTSYIDAGLSPDTWYYYWLKAWNKRGSSPFSDMTNARTICDLPDIFAVFPTYFNPKKHGVAKIYFSGLKSAVNVEIYDISGNIVKAWKKIKDEPYVRWDGKNQDGKPLNSGVYIVYIKGKNIDEKIKMIIIK